MNRSAPLAGALIAFLALASCQSRRPEMEQRASDEQQLVRIEGAFAEAALRHDAGALEAYITEDFVGVDVNGQRMDKAQVLARMQSQEMEITSLRHEDIRVRVFGDCAVATARTVVAGRYKGQETGGEFPYMRVWVKRQGRWQAVATQSSAIPKR
ncbi:MAG: nuclear transport factor 2 family protein [Acidobacteria bacterium]|nr:nuclear transport factor 2 family protein [Acidobacteriota bacterium]MCL5287698.1 nuclear transport factor 2 family protein [Acidobacteriota bacterium]